MFNSLRDTRAEKMGLPALDSVNQWALIAIGWSAGNGRDRNATHCLSHAEAMTWLHKTPRPSESLQSVPVTSSMQQHGVVSSKRPFLLCEPARLELSIGDTSALTYNGPGDTLVGGLLAYVHAPTAEELEEEAAEERNEGRERAGRSRTRVFEIQNTTNNANFSTDQGLCPRD